jgi:hypothetical protein
MIDDKNYILPPSKITISDSSTEASYYNHFVSIPAQEGAKKIALPLTITNKKDKSSYVRDDSYKVSPLRWITASMGLTYITQKFRRNDVTIQDGKVTNAADEDQLRLLAGIHIYPWPILLTDDRFIGNLKNDWYTRTSIFVGLSFPKALYNPHLGIGIEPWPGVKVIGGAHFYKKSIYTVINDQLADQRSKYVYNAPFVALNIEPVTFLKLLQIIK